MPLIPRTFAFPGKNYQSHFVLNTSVECDYEDNDYDSDVEFIASGTADEPNTDDDKLLKLISCQNFDGSFKFESALAQLLDTTLEDIKQSIFLHKFSAEIKLQFNLLLKAAEKNSYSEQVWATAVALAFMGIALADLQTTWMLVAKKAENWIRSSGKLTGDETACAISAQEYVKAKLHL